MPRAEDVGALRHEVDAAKDDAVSLRVARRPLRQLERVAALIGEAAGARSLVWYSGVSGLLAGASPWIARAAKGLERAQSVTDAEGRLALLFFLTGALTGAIYWLIAAPKVGSDLPSH